MPEPDQPRSDPTSTIAFSLPGKGSDSGKEMSVKKFTAASEPETTPRPDKSEPRTTSLPISGSSLGKEGAEGRADLGKIEGGGFGRLHLRRSRKTLPTEQALSQPEREPVPESLLLHRRY